jgi:hypothetical protein
MLKAMGVDTVVATGVTASCCVRNSVEDAIAEDFRPIVPRECVGDRVAGVIAWNLFAIDAKFGDVEPLADVLAHLQGSKRSQLGYIDCHLRPGHPIFFGVVCAEKPFSVRICCDVDADKVSAV